MRGYWWLALAAWLLASSGCAPKGITGGSRDVVKQIVISDALPNDWMVCVPLTPGTEKHHLRCMRLWEFRLWLRRMESAD